MASKVYLNQFPVVSKTSSIAATLGNFDGVHVGHQKILSLLKNVEADSRIVVSFYPHPAQVLGKVERVKDLTSLRQKLQLFSQFSIDALVLFHFVEKFHRLSAADFIDRYLIENLNISTLLVGEDARVGHNREGDSKYIVDRMLNAGKQASVVPFLKENGVKVSSGLLREVLAEGNLEKATKYLGRPFSIDGRVIHGDGRGKGIGYPTANLTCIDRVTPRPGVYATWVRWRGEFFRAASNVGVSPTFAGTAFKLEPYLLDYDGEDFYGERIEVFFIEMLRPEISFTTIRHLKERIAQDVELTKGILSSVVPSPLW